MFDQFEPSTSIRAHRSTCNMKITLKVPMAHGLLSSRNHRLEIVGRVGLARNHRAPGTNVLRGTLAYLSHNLVLIVFTNT